MNKITWKAMSDLTIEEFDNLFFDNKNWFTLWKEIKDKQILYSSPYFIENEKFNKITNEILKYSDFLLNELSYNYGIKIWKKSDLFDEISEILLYVNQFIKDDKEVVTKYLSNIVRTQFHKQQMVYMYLYSCLDKMTNLLFMCLKNQSIEIKSKKEHPYFYNDFYNFSEYFIENEIKNNFKRTYNKINKSKIFKILKDERDSQTHNYWEQPETKNISIEILFLFVLILRISVLINRSFNS